VIRGGIDGTAESSGRAGLRHGRGYSVRSDNDDSLEPRTVFVPARRPLNERASRMTTPEQANLAMREQACSPGDLGEAARNGQWSVAEPPIGQ
jgi:hypothetical protein